MRTGPIKREENCPSESDQQRQVRELRALAFIALSSSGPRASGLSGASPDDDRPTKADRE